MRVALITVARWGITLRIKPGEAIKRLVLLPGQAFARNGLAHIAQPNGPEISSLAAGGQERRGDHMLFLAIDIFLQKVRDGRIGDPSEGATL